MDWTFPLSSLARDPNAETANVDQSSILFTLIIAIVRLHICLTTMHRPHPSGPHKPTQGKVTIITGRVAFTHYLAMKLCSLH